MFIHIIYFLMATFSLGEPVPILTDQKPEMLIYDGDTLFIYVDYREHSPLSNLFSCKKYNEKLEAQIDSSAWSSACARWYAPVWKIVNNELYLHQLKHCASEKEVELTKIFNRKKISKEGVKAFWVTMEINVSDIYLSIYPLDFEAFDKIKYYEIKVRHGKIKSITEEKK